MAEVRRQTSDKSLVEVSSELVREVFETEAAAFIKKVRGISEDAASKAEDALQKVKGDFSPEAAEEIKDLVAKGDEASLIEALSKIEQLRKVLDGNRPELPTPVTIVRSLTASDILSGYKRLEDGIIELTLPEGVGIEEAGRLLNVEAKERGLDKLFYEGNGEFWKNNEANEALQTVPGKTYQYQIHKTSIDKTKEMQIKDHGEGAPLGAMAIAEACERLNTGNEGSTFFKTEGGSKIWVRGSAPGVALYSCALSGVDVRGDGDAYSFHPVAFASLASSRN